MAREKGRRSRVTYESLDIAPASHTGTPAAASLAAAESARTLDVPLALVTTVAPALGLAVAVVLLFRGYGGAVEFALAAVMYLATMIGIDVGYHRLLAHGAFRTTTPVRVVLAVLGSMAFQGPAIWWAATHRRHHHLSDHPGDPHSPHEGGGRARPRISALWHAHLGWLFDARCVRAPGWSRYARDLYRDTALFRVHMAYLGWLLLGFALPALAGGALHRTWTGVGLGLLWGGFVRLFFSSHLSWAINSLGHTYGTRPFAGDDDRSTNNVWLAIPTLGEGWHNNHHAFPSSARFGLRWWQLDPGMWCIRSLEILGLAWDIKIPTARMIAAKERAPARPGPA